MDNQRQNMGFSRRKFLAAASAGSILAIAAARGVMAADGGPHSIKLIHATPIPLLLWSVTYLAEDLGYYKEEGVTIERLGLAGGPAALAALVSGSGNANASAPGELLAAVSKGQNLKTIFSYSNFNAYELVMSKAFTERHKLTAESSLADRQAALKASAGIKIGTAGPGSLTDAVARMIIKQSGLDPDRDIQIIGLANLPAGLAALSNNAIDGFVAFSPIVEQAILQANAYSFFSVAKGHVQGGDLLQGQVLEVRTEDLETNPDAYAAMVRADLRAFRHLLENPDQSRDLLRKTRFMDIDESIWPQMWSNTVSIFRTPYVRRETLQAWFDAGIVSGVPDSSSFPFDSVVDMSLVDAAAEKMGWTPPKQ